MVRPVAALTSTIIRLIMNAMLASQHRSGHWFKSWMHLHQKGAHDGGIVMKIAQCINPDVNLIITRVIIPVKTIAFKNEG